MPWRRLQLTIRYITRGHYKDDMNSIFISLYLYLISLCFVKRFGPQLRQEKVRRPQNLSLLNDLEPPPLSLSLAPYI